MPLHDWTRVTPNDFHHFHGQWLTALSNALNHGLLPPGYYAMNEHVVPPFAPDVLTLGSRNHDDLPAAWLGDVGGGVATDTEVEVTLMGGPRTREKPPERRIAVRHAEGRRLVAVIEVVSPGNKANNEAIRSLVGKSVALLESGIHVSIIDVFPNPRRLPQGFGGAIWRSVRRAKADYAPKSSRTHSAFAARDRGACLAQFQSSEVGSPLPMLPLYLTENRCIKLPLEATYQTAWAGYPALLRPMLEDPPVTP